MSYNIDSVKILTGELKIQASEVIRLHRKLKDSMPEGCFLNDLIEHAREAIGLGAGDVLLPFGSLNWYGEGSGHSYDGFVRDVVSALHGTADVMFVWEGGDSLTGLRIKDGEAIECDVKHTLTPKD